MITPPPESSAATSFSQRLIPLTFFGVLERSFNIYRENFVAVIGLTALVLIPSAIIQYLVVNRNNSNNLSALTPNYNVVIVIYVLLFLQTVLINAPLTYLASESILGRKTSISEALRAISSRIGNLGCGILSLVLILGLMFGGFGLALVVCRTPALLLAGPLIFFIVALSALLIPVLTLENISFGVGVPRSFGLGKRRFWMIVGVGAVILIINLVLLQVVGIVAGLILFSTPNASSNFLSNTSTSPIFTAITILINVFLVPLTSIASTVVYYDIRIRTEDLSNQLESSETIIRPAQLNSPHTPLRLNSIDVRNIVILMIVSALLGLLLNNFLQTFLQQFNQIMLQRA